MIYAVEGCCHGDLTKIYSAIQQYEAQTQVKVDFLLVCGDFQSPRDQEDLDCLSCPPKYRALKDFPDYFSGKKKAPLLTIFIGGNHECVNFLDDLSFGGYVAENIYYLGASGAVQIRKFGADEKAEDFESVSVGGISGIYKEFDYKKGNFEKYPYDQNTLRSSYHTRQKEIKKMHAYGSEFLLEVMLSHDWPAGIHEYGNFESLLAFKDKTGAMRRDAENNQLGNPHYLELLKTVQPKCWFAAHLHSQFKAEVPHRNESKSTIFLALDKCLPHRRYLQIVDTQKGFQLTHHKAYSGGSGAVKDSGVTCELFFKPAWLATLKKAEESSWHTAVSKEFSMEPVTQEEIAEIEDVCRSKCPTLKIADYLPFQATKENSKMQKHLMLSLLGLLECQNGGGLTPEPEDPLTKRRKTEGQESIQETGQETFQETGQETGQGTSPEAE